MASKIWHLKHSDPFPWMEKDHFKERQGRRLHALDSAFSQCQDLHRIVK